jgi:hypothetical protein
MLRLEPTACHLWRASTSRENTKDKLVGFNVRPKPWRRGPYLVESRVQLIRSDQPIQKLTTGKFHCTRSRSRARTQKITFRPRRDPRRDPALLPAPRDPVKRIVLKRWHLLTEKYLLLLSSAHRTTSLRLSFGFFFLPPQPPRASACSCFYSSC